MSAFLGHRGLLMKKGLLPPVPARYWRLLVMGANGSSFVEINEIFMKETDGGPYVQGGGTDIIRSSQAVAAFYAFDNGFYGPSTAWRSAGNPAVTPEYIGKDFNNYAPNVKTIRIVEVKAGSNTSAAPKDFDLQYSHNNVAWVSVIEVRGSENWTANETRVFTA